MRDYNKILIPIIVVLLVMHSNDRQVDGTEFIDSQEIDGPWDLLTIDNASLTTDFFGAHLEVVYTTLERDEAQYSLDNVVALLFSKDNLSWIEVSRHENAHLNIGTKTFHIFNSLLHPFPFDIVEGETLYVSIEFEYIWGLLYMVPMTYQTQSLAFEITSDITRAWYFTIDWTLPSIFSAILLCALTVFLMSRHHRLQIERRITKSED